MTGVAAGDEAADLARLYDLDLVEDPGDLNLYLALAARTNGPVLELGVGTGRLAIPLAAAGHRVVGVDRDRAMLDRARAAAAREGEAGAEREAALARLSRDGLLEVGALCLVNAGADRTIAREAYENRWMLHADYPEHGGWAALAAMVPEIMRRYLAVVKRAAVLGGAPPELAERLEDHAFRRLVLERAGAVFGPEPHHYPQGFAWALAKVAEDAPPEAITCAAYYGPQRTAEMKARAAQLWARYRGNPGG
jgi:SAM-dependent methyltransferase